MHSLLSGDLGNQGHISSSSCSHYVVMVTPQARRLGSSPVSKNTEDIVRDPHPTHSTLSRFHGNTCPIISMGIFINKRRGDCDPDCQSDDNSTSKRSHPVGLFFLSRNAVSTQTRPISSQKPSNEGSPDILVPEQLDRTHKKSPLSPAMIGKINTRISWFLQSK